MDALPEFETGTLPAPDGGVKPYVRIGAGPRPIVVVPGAADGLRTAVDVAASLAWFYRDRARTCRLLVVSRRDPLPAEFGIERHADDMIDTVEELGWGASAWECLSAGGPIGQLVAVKRPDLADALILASSFHRIADRTRKVFRQWLTMATHGEAIDFFSNMMERKHRPPPDVLSQIDPALRAPAPRRPDPSRLRHLLQETLAIDNLQVLPRIGCPALIIGGAKDRIVPPEVQREMAELMPHSRCEICPGFGHFNDMDNAAYHEHVERFLSEECR